MSKRRKPKKSGKRLAYGVIAVIFILLCFATYSYLNPSSQNTPNPPPPPPDQLSSKAAIIDHLSLKEETKNETFKNSSTSILETVGFNVTYYPGKDVTVNFWKNLVSHNYSVIVLRVHSGIIGNSTNLSLFTSELEDESKYNTTSAPYYDDVVNKRIVRSYFPEDPTIKYFAIAPGFIEKYGSFSNAAIIMMGCDGLKYNTMAEAFIKRGARVCIGWNGLVSTPHTDHATACLLQHLAQGDMVGKAADKTMAEVGSEKNYVLHQGYESVMEYYPENAGSYTIQFTLTVSGIETLRTNTVLAKKEIRLNWLKQVSFLCDKNMEVLRARFDDQCA